MFFIGILLRAKAMRPKKLSLPGLLVTVLVDLSSDGSFKLGHLQISDGWVMTSKGWDCSITTLPETDIAPENGGFQ